MLANLLNKKKTHAHKEPVKHQWKFLIALPAWVVASYLASQFIILAVFWCFRLVGVQPSDIVSDTVFQVLVASLSYVLTLAIAIGVPYLARKRITDLRILGLQRLPSWTDIGLTPLAFIIYALALALSVYIIMLFIPSFPIDQPQDIGFKMATRQYELMIAFVLLVIIAPIAEETLFRGYLYGKLRRHVPIYAAIIVTSVLFAFAHGQWNVAIDTFVLSVVMCGLREITGSIWAGILVHMLKNAIAFYAIFVGPLLMLGG